MAATEPLVSQAPRPNSRPFRLRGVNCSSAAFTVSRCGASRTRCRALPRGERRASRFERPGDTGLELHVQPRPGRRGRQELRHPLFPGARMLRRQESRVHAGQRDQFAQELLSIRHAVPEREIRSIAYAADRLLSIHSCGLLHRRVHLDTVLI